MFSKVHSIAKCKVKNVKWDAFDKVKKE